jgi:hypothetical protein
MIEPQIDDLPAGSFRAGGDLWTEVDWLQDAKDQIYLIYTCQ